MVWDEGCSDLFFDDAGGLEDVGSFEAEEDAVVGVGLFDGAVALF